jgi:glutamine synthetase
MAKRQIAPAIEAYAADVAKSAAAKKAIVPELACRYESDIVSTLSGLIDEIEAKTIELEKAVSATGGAGDIVEESAMIRDTVLPVMSELRAPCDKAEQLTARSYWPYPTYADLLFGVR